MISCRSNRAFARLCRLAAVSLGLLMSPPLAIPSNAAPATPPYLALGDSLAYGMQIGKLKDEIAAGSVQASSFDHGYVDILASHLRAAEPSLAIVDLGCPGETSASFLAGPCAFATNGKPFGTTPLPLHTSYPGSQLTAATDFLSSHNGEVTTITIDIGINDLRAVEIGCPAGAAFMACVSAHWPEARQRTAANLNTIFGRLRAAAPKARILVMTYYNWLAVTDPATDHHVEQLNQTIATAAAEAGLPTIDAFAAFNRTGEETKRLCALTLFCGPTHDLHPSDEGYKVIGDLFADALAH